MFNKDRKIYIKTKRYLEKNNIDDIDTKMQVINSILEKKDKVDRYDYLYDLLYDYLDNEFIVKNICNFKNNICIRCRFLQEQKIKKDSYENGCCHHFFDGTTCKNFDLENRKCKVKNLSCKLFTCRYLIKKGHKFSLKAIYLSRYFFNLRQRFYLESAFYIPKEELLKEIIKRG